MNSGTQFSEAIKQLEESRGKPREEWDIEDWKSAAESLERTVSVLGKLLVSSVDVIQSLNKPQAPKKRGRPTRLSKKGAGLWMVAAKLQPLNSRHLNFKKIPKWTLENQLFLVALTDAMKITRSKTTDKDALIEVAKVKLKNKSKRLMTINTDAASMKPALSRARKKLSSQADKEAVATLAAHFAKQLSDK